MLDPLDCWKYPAKERPVWKQLFSSLKTFTKTFARTSGDNNNSKQKNDIDDDDSGVFDDGDVYEVMIDKPTKGSTYLDSYWLIVTHDIAIV